MTPEMTQREKAERNAKAGVTLAIATALTHGYVSIGQGVDPASTYQMAKTLAEEAVKDGLDFQMIVQG